MLKIFLLSLFCLSSVHSNPKPAAIDWRTKGAILPVPELSECNRPSIINVLDSISAAHQIKTGKLVKLSEQQLYDCVKPEWCQCNGDFGSLSILQKLLDSKSNYLDSDQSYPYTGKCDQKCVANRTTEVTSLQGYQWSKDPTEEGLYGLIKEGTVLIGINANPGFQTYVGGVLDDPTCADEPNHTLLLVGYGTENGVDYWIARNSWGTNWGEKGYIRLVRDKNMCGIGKHWVQAYAK